MNYKTEKTCCREINFEVKNNKIQSLDFDMGCAGNLQGISSLVIGMEVNDVIDKLEGVDCKGKGTSCPDQLAKALKKYVEQEDKDVS